MATTPSSIIRFQTSSSAVRIQPGTFVTQRKPQARQLTPPVLLNLAKEPEDARITGGTRSLARRLLALNLSGAHQRPTLLKRLPLQASAA